MATLAALTHDDVVRGKVTELLRNMSDVFEQSYINNSKLN